MKKLISTFFIFTLTIMLFSQEDRGLKAKIENISKDGKVGKQYLILIAIDNYIYWQPLSNPVNDAKEVKSILTDRYYIDEVIELYNNDATLKNIRLMFDDMQKKVKEEDSILIFYAGHGHLDRVSKTGYWIPVDGGDNEIEQDKWLPNSAIKGMLDNIPSKHVFLISDSCFSGDFLKAHRGRVERIDNDYFSKSYSLKSRQALTSGALETVPDQSEFAVQLKRILKYNNRPYLDPNMLFVDLRDTIHKTMPMFGSLTGTNHEEGANYLLFLKDEFVGSKLSKDDEQYFIDIYMEQLDSVKVADNNKEVLGESYLETKGIYQKAYTKGINTVLNFSMQKMNDIESKVNNIVNSEITTAKDDAEKRSLFTGAMNILQNLKKYTTDYQFELISKKVNDAIIEIENKKKEFAFNIAGEYQMITTRKIEKEDDLIKEQEVFDKINSKVEATKTVFTDIEKNKKEAREYLDINKKIIDIKKDRETAKPRRIGMIAGASVSMSLGVISAGLIGGFFGLNSYYTGQYDSLLSTYQSGSLTFSEYNTKRTEFGNNSNAFGYLFYAMIPTSAVFILVSAILYAAAPYESRYQKQLDRYEKMLNISFEIDDKGLYFSYGVKL